MVKKALLIQIRDNKNIAAQEYTSFLRLAKKVKVKLSKINVCYQRLSLRKVKKYDAIIIGGSEFSVEKKFPQKSKVNKLITQAIKNKKPFLGICFGYQLLVDKMGGQVIGTNEAKEFGTVSVKILRTAKQEKIFNNLSSSLAVQQAHNWGCFSIPKRTILLSRGKNKLVQGIKVSNTSTYGFQFHPELTRQDMIARMKMYNKQKKSPYLFSMDNMKKIKSSVLSEKVVTNFLTHY